MAAVSEQPLRLASDVNVKIKLTDQIWINGRVVRTDGRKFYINFDVSIDLEEIKIAPKGASNFEVSPRHKVAETHKRPRIGS